MDDLGFDLEDFDEFEYDFAELGKLFGGGPPLFADGVAPLELVIVSPHIFEHKVAFVLTFGSAFQLRPGLPHIRVVETASFAGVVAALLFAGRLIHIVASAVGALLDPRDVGEHRVEGLEVPPLAAAEGVAAHKGHKRFGSLAVRAFDDECMSG